MGWGGGGEGSAFVREKTVAECDLSIAVMCLLLVLFFSLFRPRSTQSPLQQHHVTKLHPVQARVYLAIAPVHHMDLAIWINARVDVVMELQRRAQIV